MSRENIGGGRPLRVCEVCGGYDDHPRHTVVSAEGEVGVPSPEVVDLMVQNGASGQAITDAMDPTTQIRHLDCCEQVGCPDGTCVTQLEGVPEGTTGAELLVILMEKAE
jgi:hypothetical protein